MSRLTWDEASKRYYETGVRRGVLYVQNNDGTYRSGVVWNGLIGVTERGVGGEANPVYADDKKYLNLYSREELEATIEAYSSPDEFNECFGVAEIADGAKIIQQSRRSFGFCYRTVFGNNIKGNSFGYKIHILYGCKASAQERVYKMIGDTPEPTSFSWELTTLPVKFGQYKPVAHVVIDSTLASSDAMKQLEDVLYGTATTNPRLPLPGEIKSIIELNSIWLYDYHDEVPDGHLIIRLKAPRNGNYSYADQYSSGDLVITNIRDKDYSYVDTDVGNLVISEVEPD